MSEYMDFLNICDSVDLKKRNISVESFNSIDSTSAQARRYAEGGAHTPALFVANTQSCGRGRLGRSFFSPADTGIYLTLLLDVSDDEPHSIAALTSAVAVAVRSSVQKLCQSPCQIKWVNDIYADGKKVCGILAESFFSRSRRYVAIGVGVNVTSSDFPEEIRQIAGGLCKNAAADTRRELALMLTCRIFDIYQRLCSGDFSHMEEYRKYSLVLGERVIFTRNGVSQTGIATKIDNDGALSVTLDGGEAVLLQSGEITLRLKS